VGVGAGRRRHRGVLCGFVLWGNGRSGGVGKDLGWSLSRELHRVGLAWLAGCEVFFSSPSFPLLESCYDGLRKMVEAGYGLRGSLQH